MLAAATVRGGAIVSLDDDVSRRVGDGVPAGVAEVARGATWLGGTLGTAAVVFLAVVALVGASRRVDAAFVVSLVIGVTVTVAILKEAFERVRPPGGSLVALPHSYSFPSGHAATAIALYGALALLTAERSRSALRRTGWLVLAAVLFVSIGASRVILNVHFVSDVAAGFGVGLCWLCCLAIVRDAVTARTRGS